MSLIINRQYKPDGYIIVDLIYIVGLAHEPKGSPVKPAKTFIGLNI